MNKKTNNSNNPTSGKKKWVQPIWFPEEPKKENVSPTSRTQEKPFSKKNIKHKWQMMNQYEKKLIEMLDELRDSFKGVEKEWRGGRWQTKKPAPTKNYQKGYYGA